MSETSKNLIWQKYLKKTQPYITWAFTKPSEPYVKQMFGNKIDLHKTLKTKPQHRPVNKFKRMLENIRLMYWSAAVWTEEKEEKKYIFKQRLNGEKKDKARREKNKKRKSKNEKKKQSV